MTSLIFPPKKVTITNEFFSMELDASVTETHTRSADVTEHAVEVGSNIVDHIRFRPREVEIQGIVSNTPIIFLAGSNIGSFSQVKPIVPFGDPTTRAQDAYDVLENIMATGLLCDITTSLVAYEKMALTALHTPRDAGHGNVAELNMTWRQILFAETQETDAPDPIKLTQAPEENGGSSQLKDSDPATKKRSITLFDRFSHALLGD